MHLIIILNEDGSIRQLYPQDSEYEYKMGDIIDLDNDKVSILRVETEEFLEYEFVVHRVLTHIISEEDARRNGLYML